MSTKKQETSNISDSTFGIMVLISIGAAVLVTNFPDAAYSAFKLIF